MYLSILGVVLLCYISTEKYIHGSVDIYYILDILIGLSVFIKFVPDTHNPPETFHCFARYFPVIALQ